jgi:RNA polymerase sigma-70 factor (ECF subfamily)
MIPMEETDAAAVLQARAGDTEGFRVLVERHSRGIFRLAYRMTGSEQDAEDIVQETFLRAYSRIRSFQSRANFGTWLYRIGVNCAHDLIRKRRKQEERYLPVEPREDGSLPDPPGNLIPPDGAVFTAEVRHRLRRAMGLLSPLERSAFVLRHHEGMSIEEIARALDMRVGAVKHSIFRAVRKMRGALEPVMGSVR